MIKLKDGFQKDFIAAYATRCLELVEKDGFRDNRGIVELWLYELLARPELFSGAEDDRLAIEVAAAFGVSPAAFKSCWSQNWCPQDDEDGYQKMLFAMEWGYQQDFVAMFAAVLMEVPGLEERWIEGYVRLWLEQVSETGMDDRKIDRKPALVATAAMFGTGPNELFTGWWMNTSGWHYDRHMRKMGTGCPVCKEIIKFYDSPIGEPKTLMCTKCFSVIEITTEKTHTRVVRKGR